MAKPEPGHAYVIPRLNVLFGVSAIALFLATLWMVWADYSREWKVYQRQFFQLERETTARQIEEADQNVNQRELARVEGELTAATGELETKQQQIGELETALAELNSRWTLADIRERELKAVYDSKKFFFEEGEHAPLGKRVGDEEFKALEDGFFVRREERLSIEFERNETQRTLRDLRARVTELNGQ
ncbi:MAG TPA: hypothetical protein VIG29_16745, partial [Vicinamibacteria bacterium]